MDDAEARTILRAHGEDVPARGKLSEDARIRAQHYADQDGGAGPPPGPDYDQGVTAADFPPDDEPGMVEEAPPRPPKKQPRPRLGDRLKAARAKSQAKPRKTARKAPRVPVDRLCGHAWEGLARAVAPVSLPAARCMTLQSPFFGVVMEDVIKGTFADRVLQPIARAEEKGRKVAALAGPPVLVLAREAAMGLPEPQRSVRLAIIDPLLLETLMLMDDVSAEHAEQVAIREHEMGPKRDRAIRLMQLIFAPPPGADDADTAQAQQMAGA